MATLAEIVVYCYFKRKVEKLQASHEDRGLISAIAHSKELVRHF